MIIDVIFFISMLLAFIKGFSRGLLVALLFVILYAIVFGLMLYFIGKLPFLQDSIHDSLAYKYLAEPGFKLFNSLRERFQ